MPCGSDEIPHFEITVDENGTGVKLEAHGFKGSSCVAESAKLEAAINGKGKRTLKAAFYQKVVAPIRNVLGR